MGVGVTCCKVSQYRLLLSSFPGLEQGACRSGDTIGVHEFVCVVICNRVGVCVCLSLWVCMSVRAAMEVCHSVVLKWQVACVVAGARLCAYVCVCVCVHSGVCVCVC